MSHCMQEDMGDCRVRNCIRKRKMRLLVPKQGRLAKRAASQTQTVSRMSDNHRICHQGGRVQQKTGYPQLVIESLITSLH